MSLTPEERRALRDRALKILRQLEIPELRVLDRRTVNIVDSVELRADPAVKVSYTYSLENDKVSVDVLRYHLASFTIYHIIVMCKLDPRDWRSIEIRRLDRLDPHAKDMVSDIAVEEFDIETLKCFERVLEEKTPKPAYDFDVV